MWNGINEHKPKVGDRVLMHRGFTVMEAVYLKGNLFNRFGVESVGTHWMQMPSAKGDPVYQAAVDTFGEAHQIQKAVGECGELVAELVKYFTDGKSNLDEVAQEVADVEIMMSQLRLIVGTERVEKAKAYKLDRLARLIEKTTSKND